MRPRTIFVLVVVAIVIGAAWALYSKSSTDVTVVGYGTFRCECDVGYADGTSYTITKVKAPSNSVVFSHDDKTVDKFTVSMGVKYTTSKGDDVRVLCDSQDEVHMSKLEVVRYNTGTGAQNAVATYPLSLYVQGDYREVETGDFVALWSGIEVTTDELDQLLWSAGNYELRFRVTTWVNWDPASDEVEGVTVTFTVPVSVTAGVSPADPDDGGGGSGGGGSGGGEGQRPTDPPPTDGVQPVDPWSGGGTQIGRMDYLAPEDHGTEQASRAAWRT